MDLENATAYVMYGLYNWVGIHTYNSKSRLRETILDILAYPL